MSDLQNLLNSTVLVGRYSITLDGEGNLLSAINLQSSIDVFTDPWAIHGLSPIYNEIDGTYGKDTILGHESAINVIEADQDNPSPYGDADFVVGGNALDVQALTNGNDLGFGQSGDDHMHLGDQDDLGLGGSGHDLLKGGRGNDTIDGGAGNDTIMGGSATADSLSGADLIFGGSGDDDIFSNNEDDVVYGDHIGGPSISDGDDSIATGLGNDTAYGGRGDDYIRGNSGGDLLSGGWGRDTIYGGDEDRYSDDDTDQIRGGPDADLVFAGRGNDNVKGEAGNDTLFGGIGNDQLSGGSGSDVLAGNEGGDTFDFGAGGAHSSLFHGIDTILDFLFADGDRLNLPNFVTHASQTETGSWILTYEHGIVEDPRNGELRDGTIAYVDTGASDENDLRFHMFGHQNIDDTWFF